ncbi:MAG TPA: rod shape-determining protein MreC [Rectinema sp.]|nr:rod shape-determining protein MreC [Spirochaetia bacterium]MDI9427594.1 rod shape-determining protein MreC [Spirochaetota bacterium]NLH90109.1 rod shape-determining protein MreC [Treponema sp.]OQC75232.1 MAG: Cell shape-determining protein MreC precursor [Spirochaetes bacterium ADurb.Bin001]HNP92321.1 rod shape-determining protein MreC [Rectinema sp.]
MKTGSQIHGPARAMHKKAGICLVLSIIVLFISTKTIVKVPGFFNGYIIGGIQKGLSAIGSFFTGTIGAVSELRNIERDYEALLEKVQDYELKVRDYTALREENQRLKELLGLSTLPDAKKIAAHVIARDPTNMYSSLVIDKGYINGIRKYMPVVAYQNGVEGLVGKIIEVKASTSILQPLYDQRFFAAARLAKTRAEGMLNGQGFRDVPLNLLYVPKAEADLLKRGDIVVTSGLDEIFPSEIIIGRVEDWRLNELSSSLVISVQPAIDLSRIEYVFAIDIEPLSSPKKEAIQ